jgi:hypothetical protein
MVFAAFLAKDSASLVVNKQEKALLLRNVRMNCLADEATCVMGHVKITTHILILTLNIHRAA